MVIFLMSAVYAYCFLSIRIAVLFTASSGDVGEKSRK